MLSILPEEVVKHTIKACDTQAGQTSHTKLSDKWNETGGCAQISCRSYM